MLIGLDMDGVLSDWDHGLDSRTALVPELHDYPRQPERGWNSFGDTDPRHKPHVMEILHHPEFYRDLEPIEGAVAAVKKMRADGHDVIFISSPWESNPQGHQAKADWMMQHFGGLGRKNLILTADKTIIYADVLVDDKPEIKGRLTERPNIVPAWQRIFYTQPYNVGLPGPRIENWTDGSWETVLYGLDGKM